MTPERLQEIETLFHEVLKRPPDERTTYLLTVCPGDPIVQKELEALLATHEQAHGFIESPAAEVAAKAMAGSGGFAPGSVLGQFRIISPIGAGGMGVVYLAEDSKLRRKVAIKLLPIQFTQNKDRIRRFAQEARAASALNHPNIVTIHDISETDAGHFMVMEYVEGRTLRHFGGGTVSFPTLIDWGKQVARALAAAHAAGVIHRDIKSDNIMVRDDGYVKVLDFGLARLTPGKLSAVEAEALTETSPSVLVGTVAYMSPEQARAEPVSSATDIFSLGIVLYELAAGQHPFPADSLLSRLNAITLNAPLRLSLVNPKVPPALEAVILRMLDKDALLRPTAVQVAEMLADVPLLESVKESKPELAGAAGKLRRYAWIAAGLGCILALALLGIWLYSRPRSRVGSSLTAIPWVDFIRQFGTEGNDVALGLAVAGGNVYVAGDTYGALAGPSTGQPAGFLRQYSSHGDVKWTRQFSIGSGTDTHTQDVVVVSDGVYVGGAGLEAYLRRYNTAGAEVFTRLFGKKIYPADLAGDGGVIYIAGQVCCSDAWVGRFDTSGHHEWTRQFGTDASDSARALIVRKAVYLVGYVTGTLSGQTSAGGVDAFLRKYDLEGNVVWTRQFGTAGLDFANSVAMDTLGVYIVGNTSDAFPGQTSAGSRDVFVRKYDLEGNVLWTRQFGSSKYDDATAITVNSDEVYVAGNTEGALAGQTSAGENDVFVVRFNPQGDVVWTRQLGSSGADLVSRIKADNSAIYLSGQTDGALPGQTNRGDHDAFLIKGLKVAKAEKTAN